ncbi:MAG: MarR family transcriptional regulator [Tissierellales bacterium]|jgi:DNA-binding MarR family transcriptional regulator|nr:MarR family transcriptional regulator [Tissierellales bacterium]
MKEKLLDNIAEFLEKQDLLSKLTENEMLHGYGYSDVHCVVAIKELEKPNVTNISNRLSMTRGGVSKIIKRLEKENLIIRYSIEDNKKEIYFSLTKEGEEIYLEHEKRHDLWIKRDLEFLNKYDGETIGEILSFMEDFNGYLNTKISEIGGKK